jgi:hypothetical protein
MTLSPSGGYGGETWWDGSKTAVPTGQGGFGVSRFFARPAYQAALNSNANRSVPDVALSADPAQGIVICQAANGGCPTGNALGGTSSATAMWAAFQALLNQAQGKNMGLVNTTYYPLANTAAFHSAASMGSDFSHVGLGSPNLDALHLAAAGQTAGPPSGSVSQVSVLVQAGSLGTPASPSVVPDDGTTAIVRVQLIDANGNTLGGRTVTLAGNAGSQVSITPASAVTSANDGTVTFTVKDLSPEIVTFTATDSSDAVLLPQTASLNFTGPPPAAGGISTSTPNVAADGLTTGTVVVSLQDSLGRGIPGKQVGLKQGSGHSVVNGPSPSVTDAGGKIQFSITDATSETIVYTASDVTDGSLQVPGTAQVAFGSGSGGTPPCAASTAITAAAGYAVSSFATGFSFNSSCVGPIGVAFDPAGTLYVGNFSDGSIYRFTLAGGVAGPATRITPSPAPLATAHLAGLAFSKDGKHLYAAEQATGAIDELDPATGAVLRLVTYLNVPTSLAVDPISGDLFASEDGNVGFDAVIERISNVQTASPVVTDYVTQLFFADGISFAPDGTLFAEAAGSIYRISGTNAGSPATITKIVGNINGADGMAIAVNPANPSQAQFLFVNDNFGNMTKIDLTQNPVVLSTVFSGGSRGDFVTVGGDGCAYATQTDEIVRLSNADGSCPFAQTSAYAQTAPALALTPATVAANPLQGGSQTFTATFQHLSVAAGTPVYFFVTGANTLVKLVRTDATGAATFSYTAANAGTDTVVATASVPIGTPAVQTTLASGPGQVTWNSGPHQSLLTLNLSPRATAPGKPITLIGSLADVSGNPAAAAAGQMVTFNYAGANCSGVTDVNGRASCAITPNQVGAGILNASFAGTSNLVAATAAVSFAVLASAAPPPTVNIAVSPSTVAAGSSATLTWSSTNTTACAASGSWSGAQSTGGSQSVTPATVGSYTYTLTCTGAGGTAAASAILSANLVTITVTAKSGGGSFGWSLSLMMALLLARRLYGSRTGRGVTVGLILVLVGIGPARADQAVMSPDSTGKFSDRLYLGIRVGSMPLRLDAGDINAGLAAYGYGAVRASTDNAATGGTLYLGLELAPKLDAEFGYTHRESTVARLSGAVPSSQSIGPLLQDTAGLIRGYGDIFALALRTRLQLLPRLSFEPRAGIFYWDTKVTAQGGGSSFSATHGGGGLTVGAGLAFRVWRRLELGIGADYFRGTPDNIATLYGGSLEWRFGGRP